MINSLIGKKSSTKSFDISKNDIDFVNKHFATIGKATAASANKTNQSFICFLGAPNPHTFFYYPHYP